MDQWRSHIPRNNLPKQFVRGALSKEIENSSKTSLESGLSWLFVFGGGRRSVWVKGYVEEGRRGPTRQGGALRG